METEKLIKTIDKGKTVDVRVRLTSYQGRRDVELRMIEGVIADRYGTVRHHVQRGAHTRWWRAAQ